VVNICTPNGVHAEQANCALRFGKHVVCEKPMGLTKASCESVIFNALRVGKQVFCVMQNRYSPVAQWIKHTVQTGVLGTVYMVQINCYWNRNDAYYQQNDWKGTLLLDGGPLFTQFSHFVDLLYWLFGDIQHIQARFHNFAHRHNTEFEDSGTVNFQFVAGGGLGVINYSTCAAHQNLESSMTILAENGSVKIGGQYMQEIEYCTVPNYPLPTLPPPPPPNNYGSYKGSASNHERVIENVIDTLRGSAIATTNALEGMKVVEMIERIYQLR
jgi:UDP-N-acetyl-2-amino-2-deoxyglucuronate dehydrogenase